MAMYVHMQEQHVSQKGISIVAKSEHLKFSFMSSAYLKVVLLKVGSLAFLGYSSSPSPSVSEYYDSFSKNFLFLILVYSLTISTNSFLSLISICLSIKNMNMQTIILKAQTRNPTPKDYPNESPISYSPSFIE